MSDTQVRPVLFMSGAKAVGGLSIVALNLWVAQKLSPEQYGLFAVAATGLLLLDGMVGSALDAAVMSRVAENPGRDLTGAERAGLLYKLSAGVVTCATVPAAVALTAGGPAAVLAALACIGGTGLLLHRSVLVYFQLRQQAASFGIADLAHTALRCGAVVLVLGANYVSPVAAVGAYAAASCGVALGGLALLPGWRSHDEMRAEFQAVKRAAWTALATTAVGAVMARLDLLVLSLVSTPRETGILAAAATVAMAPTWLGAYLAPAFTGRILPYSRTRRLQPFFRGVQWGLLALAVIGTVLGIVAGPTIVAHVLPPEYGAARDVVPVLLAAGAAGFFTFPLVLHTLLFLSPRTYLAMDLISLPVLLLLYVIAGRRAGALGVAWVTAGSAVVKAYVAHAAARVAIDREEARYSAVAAFSSASAVR